MIRSGFTIAALLILLFECRTAEIPADKKYVTAVFRPQVEKNSLSAPVLDSLHNRMIMELQGSGRLRLIDRDYTNKLLNEQELGQTGILDGSTAIKAGKLLGAKAIIIVKVDRLMEKTEESDAGIARKKDLIVTLDLSARMLNTETGEILAAATVSAKGVTSAKTALGATTGSMDRNESIRLAAESGGEELARKLTAVIPVLP